MSQMPRLVCNMLYWMSDVEPEETITLEAACGGSCRGSANCPRDCSQNEETSQASWGPLIYNVSIRLVMVGMSCSLISASVQ